MTIGEDESIPEALLDLGPTELDLGLTYTAVGRFKAISSLKTIFPTWSRFENIGSKSASDGKHATMQAREAEAQRISRLAAATKACYDAKWQQCVRWSQQVSGVILPSVGCHTGCHPGHGGPLCTRCGCEQAQIGGGGPRVRERGSVSAVFRYHTLQALDASGYPLQWIHRMQSLRIRRPKVRCAARSGRLVLVNVENETGSYCPPGG